MTAVPDNAWVQLICNSCGDTVAGPAPMLPDAEVVWTFIAEHGWSGSPFATGPHHCPRCTLSPQPQPSVPDRVRAEPAPMAAAPDVEQLDGVLVVTVTDDIDLATGEALHTALAAATARSSQVLVDLARVRLIDSTGLGLLVRAHRLAKERGSRLCLAAPSRFIRTVLHTMRLDGIFPIFDSRHDALRALRPAPAAPAPSPAPASPGANQRSTVTTGMAHSSHGPGRPPT